MVISGAEPLRRSGRQLSEAPFAPRQQRFVQGALHDGEGGIASV